jgi:hypothetical protein
VASESGASNEVQTIVAAEQVQENHGRIQTEHNLQSETAVILSGIWQSEIQNVLLRNEVRNWKAENIQEKSSSHQR